MILPSEPTPLAYFPASSCRAVDAVESAHLTTVRRIQLKVVRTRQTSLSLTCLSDYYVYIHTQVPTLTLLLTAASLFRKRRM